MAGAQPIVGAAIQLYAAGTTGNASAIAFAPQGTYCGDKQGRIAENRFGANTARAFSRNLGKVTSLVVEDHELYIAHACNLSRVPI